MKTNGVILSFFPPITRITVLTLDLFPWQSWARLYRAPRAYA